MKMETKLEKKKQIINWERERLRKRPLHSRGLGRYLGMTIFDREEKTKEIPTGYCGAVKITGNFLEIWTNGRYQFIKKKDGIKLCQRLLKFWGVK